MVLAEMGQQAQHVGLGAAGIAAADEVDDLHGCSPFSRFWQIAACARPEKAYNVQKIPVPAILYNAGAARCKARHARLL
jgi:hypothetical protein